jgi:hypothetical protein
MRALAGMIACVAGCWLTLSAGGFEVPTGSPTTTAPQVATAEEQLATQRIQALLGSDDPETQARVARLLQFQDGLVTWVGETIKLPDAEAQAQLDFCLKSEVIGKIAGLFTNDAEQRRKACAELAKFEEAGAEGMLLRLIDSRDRSLCLQAVDAVKSRKPTASAVEALWERAVVDAFRLSGVPLLKKPYDSRRVMDWNICNKSAEVLVTWKSPLVGPKLKEFLEAVEKYYAEPKAPNGRQVFSDKHPPMALVCDLMRAHKPSEAVPVLMKVVTGKAYPGGNMAMAGNQMLGIRRRLPNAEAAEENNKEVATYFWTTRTLFIAMLVEVTGQKAEDYGLKVCQPAGGYWSFASEKEEEKAVAKLKEWWAAHQGEYEAAGTATLPATGATLPAAVKEVAP